MYTLTYTEIALEMVTAFWKLESGAITLWGAQIHKRHTAYRIKTLPYTLMDHKILLRGLPSQFTLKTTAGTCDISISIYICVCICIYMYTSAYIFIYILLYIYSSIIIHIPLVYIYTHKHIHIHLYV